MLQFDINIKGNRKHSLFIKADIEDRQLVLEVNECCSELGLSKEKANQLLTTIRQVMVKN
jgi:hypothetical protein